MQTSEIFTIVYTNAIDSVILDLQTKAVKMIKVRSESYPKFLATGVSAALAVFDRLNSTALNSSETSDVLIIKAIEEMMLVCEFTYDQLSVSTGYYELATMYFLNKSAFDEFKKEEQRDYNSIYR